MLRKVLLAIGIAALCLTPVAALSGVRGMFVVWCGMLGVMLTAGILFERGRYKPNEPRPPGPGWVATGERFRDPQSGDDVTVFYLPATGERRYVAR